ncbi:MAG: ATP synthase subunit I [Gammaproteobacteria bacterium]
MNDGTLTSTLVLLAAMALSGLAFGLVYFRALQRTVDLFADGRGWLGPAGFTLARIAGAVIVLTFMARLGAMPLLAGFLGFLLARAVSLRSARRTF